MFNDPIWGEIPEIFFQTTIYLAPVDARGKGIEMILRFLKLGSFLKFEADENVVRT